ncbi:hypothetical protein V5O48_005156 [Marasmius crinis-equi]|uniref:Uncharacterized protein n=1 Tax=Marasmius crinis-equi TaxID=585013 RepID=A0ABR3FN30_9AGAR
MPLYHQIRPPPLLSSPSKATRGVIVSLGATRVPSVISLDLHRSLAEHILVDGPNRDPNATALTIGYHSELPGPLSLSIVVVVSTIDFPGVRRRIHSPPLSSLSPIIEEGAIITTDLHIWKILPPSTSTFLVTHLALHWSVVVALNGGQRHSQKWAS